MGKVVGGEVEGLSGRGVAGAKASCSQPVFSLILPTFFVMQTSTHPLKGLAGWSGWVLLLHPLYMSVGTGISRQPSCVHLYFELSAGRGGVF